MIPSSTSNVKRPRHPYDSTSTTLPKRYNCKQCPFTTTNESSIWTHRKCHNAHHPYKCPECSCSYRSLQPLHYHIRRVHPNSTYNFNAARQRVQKEKSKNSTSTPQPPLLACRLCHKMIIATQMTNHRRRYHPEVKPYYCTQCPYLTSAHGMIWKHRKSHSIPNTYTCLYCTSSYDTLTKCNIHIRRVHPRSPLIPQPGLKKTKQLKQAATAGKKLEEKVNRVGEFKCSFCERSFPFQSRLRLHEARHTLPFICSQCPRRFPTNYNLRDHLRKCHRPKLPLIRARIIIKVECPACEVKLAGQEKLYQHLKIYHPKFPAYSCKECPFVTADRGALWRHGVFHRVPNVYSCGHCTASFSLLTTRDQHIRSVHPSIAPDLPHEASLGQRKASVHPAGFYYPKEPHRVKNFQGKCHVCGDLIPGRTPFYNQTCWAETLQMCRVSI